VRDNQSIKVAMEEIQNLFDEHYEKSCEHTKNKEPIQSKLSELVASMCKRIIKLINSKS
jgi:hypothetical protein